jgi:hypothetical protein
MTRWLVLCAFLDAGLGSADPLVAHSQYDCITRVTMTDPIDCPLESSASSYSLATGGRPTDEQLVCTILGRLQALVELAYRSLGSLRRQLSMKSFIAFEHLCGACERSSLGGESTTLHKASADSVVRHGDSYVCTKMVFASISAPGTCPYASSVRDA